MHPFYKTTKWRRKRERILRRDGYLCQESRRYGKSVPATTVHHIYPLEEYPELALVDWNLISLSEEKHNAMHDRATGEVTELGRYWQERVRPQLEAWFRSKNRADNAGLESNVDRGSD